MRRARGGAAHCRAHAGERRPRDRRRRRRPGRLRRGTCARRALYGRARSHHLRAAHDRSARSGLVCTSGPTIPRRPAWRRSTPAGRSIRMAFSRWARARCARRRAWSGSCSQSSATRRTPRAAFSCWKAARCRPTPSRRGWPARPASVLTRSPSRSHRRRAWPAACRLSRGRSRPACTRWTRSGFDVTRVVSAMGTAPLPPTARNDLRAIGRTNDCVLYGGRVRYSVRAEDAELESLAARLPASSLGRLRHALPRHLQALRQRLL